MMLFGVLIKLLWYIEFPHTSSENPQKGVNLLLTLLKGMNAIECNENGLSTLTRMKTMSAGRPTCKQSIVDRTEVVVRET